MGDVFLWRDFQEAAKQRSRHQSAPLQDSEIFAYQCKSRLKWAEHWLALDLGFSENVKALLASREQGFNFKLQQILETIEEMNSKDEEEREAFARRALVTMILQDRVQHCRRYIRELDENAYRIIPRKISPLPDPAERLQQAAPWWDGGPITGRWNHYINMAMVLIDGTYNDIMEKHDTLRPAAAPARASYHSLMRMSR